MSEQEHVATLTRQFNRWKGKWMKVYSCSCGSSDSVVDPNQEDDVE